MAQLTQSPEEPDAWPTIEEAAARLNTSVRTMWRHAEARRIEMRKRARPGKKPENICNPADIERLMPAAHVMPEESFEVVAINRPPPSAPAMQQPWYGALETIATILTRQNDTGAIDRIDGNRIDPDKLVLTLKEAARSGFSIAFLRREVESGRLKSFRDGRTIKISRAALAAFAEGLDG
jgi:hypothetical protein